MEEEQDERNVMPSSPHGAETPECSNYYVRNKLLSSLNHVTYIISLYAHIIYRENIKILFSLLYK